MGGCDLQILVDRYSGALRLLSLNSRYAAHQNKPVRSSLQEWRPNWSSSGSPLFLLPGDPLAFGAGCLFEPLAGMGLAAVFAVLVRA